MRAAAGQAFTDWGAAVEVNYKAGEPARIDGTVASRVAVEVESRVSKQVRGALLDLICHRYPKKLLVLRPVHMNDAEVTAEQCRFILHRFLAPTDFRVVVLAGTGENPKLESDAEIVKHALSDLGCRQE